MTSRSTDDWLSEGGTRRRGEASSATPIDETGTSSDAEPETYCYVIWTDETPSEAVVEAVTNVTGRDPRAVPPLYETVDTDALDRLANPPAAATRAPPSRLSFTYLGRNVEIRDGQYVVVREPTDE